MSLVKRIVVEKPLLSVGCTLGEGPIYEPRTYMLHFVDISERKVFHLNTSNLHLEVEQYDEPITSLALRQEGRGLACTTARGFALLEQPSRLRYLSQPLPANEQLYTRFNDGGCDCSGQYFAGTIQSKEHHIPGKLFRYNPRDGTCCIIDEGPFTDSNGLGWSPDQRTFYLTDSLVNLIYAYDYDKGGLSNRRIFVDAIAQGFQEGTYCDGLCVDDEGYVWSARWGGSRIIRYAPDGTLDLEIFFPSALNITSCCFGGPNNDQLYVTTAHCGAIGGDASRQARYPDSGDLFVVDFSGQFRGSNRWEFGG